MWRTNKRDRRLAAFAVAVVATAVAAMLVPAEARADRRIFGYVYPPLTLPKGGFEIEHYLDMGLNGWDDPATPELEQDWTEVDQKHQLEFEFGATDHLDVGFYNVFRQKPFGDFGYEGVKVRVRYRFGPGNLVINPALYLEVGYFGDEVKFEQILILGRRYGGLEFSINVKAEEAMSIENRPALEFELFPTAGIGYHFNNHVALSLEYYGKLKVEEGAFDYYVSYLGPTLSVAGPHFFWTVAVQPQLGTDRKRAAVQIRSLFGIMF